MAAERARLMPISCSNYACDSASNTCRTACTGSTELFGVRLLQRQQLAPKNPTAPSARAPINVGAGRAVAAAAPPEPRACALSRRRATSSRTRASTRDLSGWTVTPEDGFGHLGLAPTLWLPVLRSSRLSWPDEAATRQLPPTISTCVPVRGGSYNRRRPNQCRGLVRRLFVREPNCAGRRTPSRFFSCSGGWPLSRRSSNRPSKPESPRSFVTRTRRAIGNGSIDMAFFTPAPGLY